nr:chloramphenicol phosphotransferase CPT family protein [Cytobacillus depressus]
MVDLIILNGGSSSGKSTIAKCLQNLLPRPWLRFSIDD